VEGSDRGLLPGKPRHSMGGAKVNHEDPQDSLCPDQESNQASSEPTRT
jgi:hypothetical protein